MQKMKKMIICLSAAFLFLFSFSLSVFAVHSSGGGNSQYIRYEYDAKENFNGSSYVFNSCPTYCHTTYAVDNGCTSAGFDCYVDLKVTRIVRNSEGFIIQIYFTPISDYSAVHTLDYTSSNILYDWSSGVIPSNLQTTIHSIYSNITSYGYEIDWNYITIPENLVEAGEQFTYYDYFGKPKTVTFNGNGSIYGANNGGKYDFPEGEFPKLEDYLPDSSDDKYQSTSLSEYLPAPPDSIDILDWIKYFIDCFKAVFNWLFDNLSKKFLYLYDVLKGFFSFVSDFFKSFFENLRNIFISFFDFKDLIENNYLSNKFAELRDYVFIKFPFFNTFLNLYSDINGLISATTREAPTITFVLPEILGGRTEVVSLDFLNPVIAVTDVIVIAACYLLTIIYSIRAIPNIIGGIGSAYSGLDRSFNDFDNSKK